MIGIFDYGAGNIGSVINVLNLLNKDFELISNKQNIFNYEHYILPGVGSFKHAMQKLEEKKFIEPIKKISINKSKKILGICLGMQLFYDFSDEDDGCEGLGIINGVVKRISKAITPNVGWHPLELDSTNKLFYNIENKAFFYFVHSYACFTKNNNIVKAKLDYGEIFDVIIQTENIVGTQFHPEKSQKSGIQIIKNFINI